jgi:hypothetical protein
MAIKVETNCKDEKRESDSNDWYDNIHIPDGSTIPAFIRHVI